MTAQEDEQPQEHWGAKVIALLDQLDMSEWEALDIDDPVEWVQLRQEELKRREVIDNEYLDA